MKFCSPHFFRAGRVAFVLAGCTFAAAQTAQAPLAAAPTAAAAATDATAKVAATQTVSAPAKTVTPALTLPQQIAALPRLTNPGIDTAAQGKAMLDHLNDVLRFYRQSTAQAQKVGEPSDVLFGEQATTQAMQIGQTAFQSARNLAALFDHLQPSGTQPAAAAPTTDDDSDTEPQQPTTAQRLAIVRTQVQARIADLSAQDAALDKQITTAKAKDLPALRQRDEQLEGQLELQKAMLDALGKVASMADAQTATGLAGEVARLLRAAPELGTTTAHQTLATPSLESLSADRSAGVSSQAIALFQLLSTRREIENRLRALDELHKQATDVRTPILKLLKSTIQQGDDAMQAPPNTSSAEALAATRKHYDTLSSTFRILSTATLPTSQEIVLIESARANLVSWNAAVDAEYSAILRSLLTRVALMAIALLILFVLSQVWKRLTVKYVHDMRRRRGILILRRTVLGFLSGIVIIFGFVTQFSSLATFAGFITAGIAVGLQTILLSVAAYFFIVGRYGVRVGGSHHGCERYR